LCGVRSAVKMMSRCTTMSPGDADPVIGRDYLSSLSACTELELS